MDEIAAGIRRHLEAVAGEVIGSSVAMQLVQAPVFHGYTMSVFAELPPGADLPAVRKALEGSIVQIAGGGEDSPSNQGVMEDAGIKIAIHEEPSLSGSPRGCWLWMAADNLKLAARHAMVCAAELVALRPADNIQ
jgi:aspartate-semialdehyde dehydrogenase